MRAQCSRGASWQTNLAGSISIKPCALVTGYVRLPIDSTESAGQRALCDLSITRAQCFKGRARLKLECAQNVRVAAGKRLRGCELRTTHVRRGMRVPFESNAVDPRAGRVITRVHPPCARAPDRHSARKAAAWATSPSECSCSPGTRLLALFEFARCRAVPQLRRGAANAVANATPLILRRVRVRRVSTLRSSSAPERLHAAYFASLRVSEFRGRVCAGFAIFARGRIVRRSGRRRRAQAGARVERRPLVGLVKQRGDSICQWRSRQLCCAHKHRLRWCVVSLDSSMAACCLLLRCTLYVLYILYWSGSLCAPTC